MSGWITVPEGKHCALHGETFALGEVCNGCVAAPSPGIIETESCGNVHDDLIGRKEVRVFDLAEKLYTAGESLLGESPGDAAKVIAEGTKAMRLGLEYLEKRARRDHVRQLKEAALQMAGLRSRN